MTFTYTPEQASVIAASWNSLANDRNQISASDVHNVFGDNADDDMATMGATLVEVRASHSATGAPATFYVMSEDVTVEYVATISHHSIARSDIAFVVSTLHAAKINATRFFGGGYLDHLIQVMDSDGVVVASRRVGDKRWSTL